MKTRVKTTRIELFGVFARDDRSVAHLRFVEMLVLDYARIRHVELGIIHHGVALIIGYVERFGLEPKRTVFQLSVF